ARAVRDGVREVRAAAGDQRGGEWSVVRALDVGGEIRAQTFEIDPVGCGGPHAAGDTSGGRRTARRVAWLRRALCDLGRARGHGVAVALGVAGDPPDRHVDPEPGRGALLFGLAAPEPVLAVLARPVAARHQHLALRADRTGL